MTHSPQPSDPAAPQAPVVVPPPPPARTRFFPAVALLGTALIIALFAALGTSGGDDRDGGTAAPAPAEDTAGEGESRSEGGEAPEEEDERPDLARRTAGDPFAIGAVDAPVVMIEYADFRCGYCGQFARETKPELIRSYVEDGLLRIEWRHTPVLGEESVALAVASHAAAEQDRFWEFHDAVYGGHATATDTESLVALARQAGVVDLDRFRADLDSREIQRAVLQDVQEALTAGFGSTPSFLVNGRMVIGAQPIGWFEAIIDDELRKSGHA
ncbi:DsbA family protein [Streptomyces aidingensis]|uniref:Thioredoxin n=1 Tax=Streptomyces aidingensis TaxID=910347 RepID=A0A1I1EH73_9ACTN|nr:thioredoxin domain-containing protein [Streptomyces aidingensis]SFB84320.1 Thioredoxin [Streptomyces aidingensis]